MIKLASILVAYDSSSFAKQALRTALSLSSLFGAKLHIVNIDLVHGAPLVDPSSPVVESDELEATVLRENMEIEDLFEGQKITYAMGRDVSPAPSILAYASDQDVDLIVVGTHGRNAIGRLFLGSVAEEIVRYSACPVLTVRDNPASYLQLEQTDRIIVPIDFSKHAMHALAHAKHLAKIARAQIELVHVIQPPNYPLFRDPVLGPIYRYPTDIDQLAKKHLAQFYERTPGPIVKATFHVRFGHPAQEIVEIAGESEAKKLIVMSTHGASGLNRFFLGSVASKTIRKTPYPVFIIKSFGKLLIDIEEDLHQQNSPVLKA